jgi:hypothetical protein
MTTNNPSYVPIQHPLHSSVQSPQVCITRICDVPLLSHISMQTLGGRDHELWSNEYLPGIDSAGPYPTVNHHDADAPPPTRYTSTMGNEDPPHVVIVINISVFMLPLLTVADEGRWATPRERKSRST